MVGMKVIWTLSTGPVVIGDNLSLFCNTSRSSCFNCTKRWLKGQMLLSFHNSVTNADKYAVEEQKDGFTLEIKNTTFEDFNFRYECSYGFSSFTENLTLPTSFEYFPKSSIKKNLSVIQEELLLAVDFKRIHPIPVCCIYLDKENLSSRVKKETEKMGYLYQVKVTLHHTVKPDQCEGRLLVYCTTGTKKDTIVNDTVSFVCSGVGDSRKAIIITSAVICMVVIAITVLCVMKGKNLRMKLCRQCKVIMNKKESNSNCGENDTDIKKEML